MSKNIAEFKNPMRANSINPLNPMEYISSIGYVAWIGLIFVAGAKLLVMADKVIPGENTPNSYKTAIAQPVSDKGITII